MDTLPESVTMSTSHSADASADDAAASGNSGNGQSAAQTAALRKLSEGGFEGADLPQWRDDPLWGEIRTEYNLSLPELSALKNFACSPANSPRGVLPRVGGDGVLYRINDQRIRSKFTISNIVPPHRYTFDAELLVDSGANTELKLPTRKVLQLRLQSYGPPSRSRGSTNSIGINMNFNPVLVKAAFTRNGVEEVVEKYLDVKCDKKEYDELVAERAGRATLTGDQQGDQYLTPQQHSNTPVADATKPGHITEIHLTPTRHRPSDQPLQQAVIGIDGLRKLRLHLNCELQQLEIEEEEVLDDEEY